MLVSSTSMNAAMATTMAISQGLNRGFQGSINKAVSYQLSAVSKTGLADS
jgi:hypothetical protein